MKSTELVAMRKWLKSKVEEAEYKAGLSYKLRNEARLDRNLGAKAAFNEALDRVQELIKDSV